ncbi:MAG TPA: glycosyltransferase family 4 protein [Blastocatellia bacterium]|nr:glycosyltransferase family 4 protein [Blastocatellia bacterium]
MKLLYLTAGAAGMYCGSCLRDNALAAELMKQGHDVMLLPLYTPTLTDEPNVSLEKTFFGGISVYLEQHSSLFRNTPAWMDKLWDSALALKLASKRSISVNPQSLGELTISMLRGEAGNQRKELFKLLDWMREQDTPDAVTLQNSMLIGLAAPIRKTLRRPVVCTLQGEDLFLESLREPYRSEALKLIRAGIEHVDAFMAVSDYYADFMADYLGIPRRKVHVVPLGINFDGFEAGNGHSPADTFVVGYFGRIAPEKGLHLLAEAYKLWREQHDSVDARLEAAGWIGPEGKAYLDGIERRMKEWGLEGEFHYRGTLDRQGKVDFLRRLSVFSMPATYAEPKGLTLLEAMAAGVPVIQPRHGSFTEIVERTGGGILVEPNDAGSLAAGIHSLYQNPELATDLGRRGAIIVREHYSAGRMAERAIEVYGQLVP